MRVPRLVACLASVGFAASIAGCGSSPPTVATPGPAATLAGQPSIGTPTAPPVTPPASVPPSASPGFVFDPESVTGYFESIGFDCGDRVPSSQAAGFEYQSCQLVDPEGRTRTAGFVTDSEDNLADAFLSVRGRADETVLEPSAVLEPFAGFLGAALGEGFGSATLPWLAAHLGDPDSRTTLGDLTIATYLDSPDDHAKLTVEIANRAYLEAPGPSPSP